MYIEQFYPIMEQMMNENALEHHHNNKKKDGASNRYGCKLKRALNKKGITVPPLSGVRSETGALYTGGNFHKEIQSSLRKAWFNDPIKRAKNIYIEEIYVWIPVSEMTRLEITQKLLENPAAKEFLAGKESVIIPNQYFEEFPDWESESTFLGTTEIDRDLFDVMNHHPEWLEELGVKMIMSPIDVAYISKPGYILKNIEFDNCSRWKPILAKGAFFEEIVDIKSCSDFSFYQQLNGKISPNYDYQFQSYCLAAERPYLTELAVHKENMRMFEKIVKRRDSFYNELLERENRLWDIIDSLPSKMDPLNIADYPNSIKDSDLDCVCDLDSFEFWGCGLCECHEELDDKQKPHNIVDRLCPLAEKILVDKALEKFRPGMKFKRGLSHITIDHWEGSTCIVMNKGGTIYKDHAKYCLQTYSVM